MFARIQVHVKDPGHGKGWIQLVERIHEFIRHVEKRLRGDIGSYLWKRGVQIVDQHHTRAVIHHLGGSADKTDQAVVAASCKGLHLLFAGLAKKNNEDQSINELMLPD
jgi:hypothetical protein